MTGAKMQQYAISIEHDLCNEYDCQRFGIGGIANSDYIRRVGLFHGISMVLVKYYFGDNVKAIDDFLEDINYYAGLRMDDIELNIVEDIIKKYDELYKSLRIK